MHTYERRWADDQEARTLPDLGAFRFTNPPDVVAYAELDWLLTWDTYPDVWHLDETGAFRCSSKGSTFDSVRTFAERPEEMLDCRAVELDHPCPDRWLVIEPRHPRSGDRYQVTEDDAQAFLVLRRALTGHGNTLLDVMLFDQEFHWWSLHELTTGRSTWT